MNQGESPLTPVENETGEAIQISEEKVESVNEGSVFLCGNEL